MQVWIRGSTRHRHNCQDRTPEHEAAHNKCKTCGFKFADCLKSAVDGHCLVCAGYQHRRWTQWSQRLRQAVYAMARRPHVSRALFPDLQTQLRQLGMADPKGQPTPLARMTADLADKNGLAPTVIDDNGYEYDLRPNPLSAFARLRRPPIGESEL